MPHENHHHAELDSWRVEGRLLQLIYSPRGAIEGVLIESDGIFTQFVTDSENQALSSDLLHLTKSPCWCWKAPNDHPRKKATLLTRCITNYAKHGAPNGVVLDNGDFVHTEPKGFEAMRLKVGQRIQVKGSVSPMECGLARVIEAEQIDGALLR